VNDETTDHTEKKDKESSPSVCSMYSVIFVALKEAK